MTSKEKFGHWKFYAERDLDAAEAMFETGRWFYVVFMCQQAVEKLVKGIYNLYVDDDVPRTHNIEMIANRIEDSSDISFNEDKYQMFRGLSKYYLADRYPDFLSESGVIVDRDEADYILHRTREVFAWLLSLKPSED
ncbi:MAG: HEPN domain-containing protein [Defluviitaleaceae bacterium]|nr:HEPN domain-containing protein [Defluviitaleaceae bacterium]